ncbi:MAG: 4-hydroxy-tetrahydrodipicolinate synthase [Lentisphaeria bacterium]|nr:4-hydroxy-tetrahydrodipicolinate synthase [Lentisphaeria bacterium]
MKNLQGVYTALVTPYRNGGVDYEALNNIIELQIKGKVAGIVPVGTTGESPTLSCEEHLKVIEFTVEKVAKRCTVIAGTGANSTAEAIELTVEARKLGADATLQVTPYYNKPTEEGQYRHFMSVAEKGELPVVLYNVPGRAGVPISEKNIARMSSNPLIVAVKEAGGNVERVSKILDMCDITILSGDDALTLPMMSVGAKGIISVASNLIPGEMTEMVESFLNGDLNKAMELHKKYYCFFRDQFIETNPIPIKAAMAMAGLIEESYRLPLCELTAEHREQLKKSLVRCGILK